MVGGPGQVWAYGIVDPDVSVRSTLAAYFHVEVVERWSKKWEHIEAPVDPTGESLPFLQCEFSVASNEFAYCGN